MSIREALCHLVLLPCVALATHTAMITVEASPDACIERVGRLNEQLAAHYQVRRYLVENECY